MKSFKTFLLLPLISFSLFACGGPVEGGGTAAAVVDTTPPTIKEITPTDPVQQVCSVTVEFDDPILESTVSPDSFQITEDGAENPLSTADGTWGVSPDNNKIITFEPSGSLIGKYNVTVTTDIANTAELNLETSKSWSFTASQACSTSGGGDTTPPTFVKGDPDGPVDQVCSITAEFNEPILESTITPQSFVIQSATSTTPLTSADGTWSLSSSSDTIAFFEPSVDLVGIYTVKLTTDITDTSGNKLNGIQSWTFNADKPCGSDTTPPQFIASSPQDNETVAQVCEITAEFDEALDGSTVSATSFIITNTDTTTTLSAGDGTWGLSPTDDKVALFVPAISLVGNFEITLTTAIANTAGLNLAANESWTFTASQACGGDTTAPQLIARNPEGPVNNVCEITAEFDEAIDATTVDEQSFIIHNDDTNITLSAGDGDWGVSPNNDGVDAVAFFIPAIPLLGNHTVTITTNGITDTAGNNLAAEESWSFSAALPCPP